MRPNLPVIPVRSVSLLTITEIGTFEGLYERTIMADKNKDKKDKKGNEKEKSITDILSDSRNMLYGENVELTSVLTNVLTLLGRTIRYRTSVNTTICLLLLMQEL